LVYQLRDGIEFLKSLPDNSVDGIFTDPPWKRGTKKKTSLRGADIYFAPFGSPWPKKIRGFKPQEYLKASTGKVAGKLTEEDVRKAYELVG